MEKVNISLNNSSDNNTNIIIGNIGENYYNFNIQDFDSNEEGIVNDVIPILSNNISLELYNTTFGYDHSQVNIIRPLNNLDVELVSMDYNDLDNIDKSKIDDLIDLLLIKINS